VALRVTENPDAGSTHSQAFEKLVQSEDDITGLLAYALYKQAIREAARQGRVVHSSAQRSPVATEIAAFRGATDSKLSIFAASIVDQSRATIIDTAIRADIGAMEERLQTELRNATSWRNAIVINLLAWLLSIAITFLIAVAGVPGWIIALLAKLKGG
jgi:hypothetical protein